jgi:hypothetical protein
VMQKVCGPSDLGIGWGVRERGRNRQCDRRADWSGLGPIEGPASVRGDGDESGVGAARGASVGVGCAGGSAATSTSPWAVPGSWATAASFAPATLSEHSASNDNIRTWSRAAAHGGRQACCRWRPPPSWRRAAAPRPTRPARAGDLSQVDGETAYLQCQDCRFAERRPLSRISDVAVRWGAVATVPVCRRRSIPDTARRRWFGSLRWRSRPSRTTRYWSRFMPRR